MAKKKKVRGAVNWGAVPPFLDEISDGTVLLLKGHLLVEEALYGAVHTKCLNPEFIDNPGLGFGRLISVAKAFFYKEEDAALWAAIDSLNSIRNRLAHDLVLLEPDLADHFEKITFGYWKPKNGFTINDKETFMSVAAAIGMITAGIWKASGHYPPRYGVLTSSEHNQG